MDALFGCHLKQINKPNSRIKSNEKSSTLRIKVLDLSPLTVMQNTAGKKY